MNIPTLTKAGCQNRRHYLIDSVDVDVITFEPGAYTKKCAGRIEHIFLITENGPELLTRHNTKFVL